LGRGLQNLKVYMKKLLTGVLAIAMVLTLVGGVSAPARAATIDELQAQIAQLQALLASLTGGGSSSTGYMFTTDLTVGSTGTAVVELQKVLVAKGFLTMPAGVPMGYFGALTRAAVAAWQAANGIAPAVGYFGPISRARMNATVVVTPPGPGPSTPSGDEGQLTNIDNITADVESDIDEGEDDVYVFGAELEAEDSDMTIDRVDVDFTLEDADTTQSDNLDDYITEVSLFLDGEKLASMDVDEADVNDAGDGDFTTAADGNDVYSFRFTGLNGMIDEDETGDLYVAVSAASNIDTADETADWYVLIPDDGIRATDGAGISDTYVDASDLDEEIFSVGEADGGDIDLSLKSSENEDRIIVVDDDNDTNGEEVLVFRLESQTSDNVVDEIEIDFATTTSTSTVFSTVINSVHLYADGTLIGTEDVDDNATDPSGTALFENLDLAIDEDEEVEFTVKVDFNDEADEREGFSFEAIVDASAIDAEDASGDNVTVTGDVTGGDIELRTTGIAAEFVSATESVRTGSIAGDPDIADFTIKFTVTAIGDEDVFIDGETVAGVVALTGTDGLTWATTTDSTTGTSTSGTTAIGTATLSASGDTSDDVTTSGSQSFALDSGETRTFTFSVSIPAGGDNVNAGVMVTGIKWDTDSDDGHANVYNFDLDDFRTDTVTGLIIH